MAEACCVMSDILAPEYDLIVNLILQGESVRTEAKYLNLESPTIRTLYVGLSLILNTTKFNRIFGELEKSEDVRRVEVRKKDPSRESSQISCQFEKENTQQRIPILAS